MCEVKGKINECKSVVEGIYCEYIENYSDDIHERNLKKLRKNIVDLSNFIEKQNCDLCPKSKLNTQNYQSLLHMIGYYKTEDYICWYHNNINPILDELLENIDGSKIITNNLLVNTQNSLNTIISLL